MWLIYLTIAWTSGIVIASSFSLPVELWLWWLVLPLGLLVIWRRNRFLRSLHLSLLVFLLGAIRYTLAQTPEQ